MSSPLFKLSAFFFFCALGTSLAIMHIDLALMAVGQIWMLCYIEKIAKKQ